MIRFATWAAVSSKPQAKGWNREEKEADDKDSIPNQLETCCHLGLSKGWQDTTLRFIVPGKSRTRWVNLRDAELAIPQLRDMLESAKAGNFDVLVLYDYNRLRDLLDPVAKTLASYGVQIASVNQFVEPLSPEEFTPYASDAEPMMRGVKQIADRAQLATLRRYWRTGVWGRVEKGLYSLKIPWGYMKAPGREHDSKGVPVLSPVEARVVVEIKNLFLSGHSSYDIAVQFNERRVPTPYGGKKWHRSTIEKILQNPFYAGKVFVARRKTIRDPRDDSVRYVRNPTPKMNDGRHKALYSWEEYQMILSEFDRRSHIPTNARHPWSGLLVCSVCGSRLYHMAGVWRCKYPGTDHIALKVEEANSLILPELQSVLRNDSPNPSEPKPLDHTAILADLDRRKRRIQEMAEKEIYSIAEAEEKLNEIKQQVAKLKDEEGQRLRQESRRKQFLSSLREIQELLAVLPEWIKERKPRAVNNLLLRLVKEIIVTPERKITIRLREE